MDRNAQIEFLQNCEDRVRSYVSRWLQDPAVREAVHRRPQMPHDGGQDDGPPVADDRRKYG